MKTVARFVDAPRDEPLKRLSARNAGGAPDTFRVEEAELDGWGNSVEPPTPDADYVVLSPSRSSPSDGQQARRAPASVSAYIRSAESCLELQIAAAW